MEGYVRNISRTWRHALKRSIAPGQKVDLDVLYAEYGERHGIEEGKPFAEWLRKVKLKDAGTWEISYREPLNIPEDVEGSAESEEVIDKPAKSNDNVNPFVKKDQEAMDIVNMSVRIAKAELVKITDIKLLKNALNIARTQAGKDTLTIMLRKRIKELEVSSRR